MKQYSVSILKKEWAKYQGLSLQRIMENHIFPREDMYDVQVVQEIPDDIQSPQDLIEKVVRPWAGRKMLRNINGIIMETNDNGISIARYLEEDGSLVLPDYYMAPDDLIGMESRGIHIVGFPRESWYPIECINLDGIQLFLLDSERFPNTHEYLVVNGKIKKIIQTMQPGFNDLLISQIRENLSIMQIANAQEIEMAKRYSDISDRNECETDPVYLPNNYSSLSLREKIEIQRKRRSY